MLLLELRGQPTPEARTTHSLPVQHEADYAAAAGAACEVWAIDFFDAAIDVRFMMECWLP